MNPASVRYSLLFAALALMLALLSSPSMLAAAPGSAGGGVHQAADGVLAGPGLSDPAPRAAGGSLRAGLLDRALFLQDPQGGLTLVEALAGKDGFAPWGMGIGWRGTGPVWMRLSLEGMEGLPDRAWLCLGTQTAGGDEVWTSHDGQSWSRAGSSRYSSWLLDAERDREVMVRMRGTPGLWFSPRLSAVEDPPVMASGLLRMAAVAALGLLSLCCILLSLSGRSDGHLWTGLLAAACAVHAWFGVPTAGGKMDLQTVCCVFSAGMALMLLPHAGRAVMSTGRTARKTDIFYMLLALPGAVLALLPLVPSLSWAARLLVLWPLFAALCFLPAFVLIFRGVNGSLHYSAGCLLLAAGGVAALYGLRTGTGGEIPFAALEAGIIAGIVLMASASPQRARAEEPAMALLPPASEEMESSPGDEDDAVPAKVREGVEKLLDASCRLDQALSRAGIGEEKADIVVHADDMVAAARGIAGEVRALPPDQPLPAPEDSVFDLRTVIQAAFQSVHEEAEEKGLGLAWYVSPHIGRKFRGDAASLNALLGQFMADAVRASSSGTVSLRVRRLESSTHPGHLMFDITDSGQGCPPHGRHSLLLARLWELVARHGGELLLDSGPKGTSVSFSMEFDALEQDGTTVKSVPGIAAPEGSGAPGIVILSSEDGLRRRIWADFLGGLGFRIWEAGSAMEAVRLYAVEPAALVIFHGALGEDDIIRAIAGIRMEEGERSLPAVPFLLLATGREQALRMADAGCGQWLPLPVLPRELRAMVRWLCETGGRTRRPLPADGLPARSASAGKGLEPDAGGDGGKGPEAPMGGSPQVPDDRGGAAGAFSQPESGSDGGREPLAPPEESPEGLPGAGGPAEGAGKTGGLLSLDSNAGKDSGSWLSSVFGGAGRQGEELELLPAGNDVPEDAMEDIVDLPQEHVVTAGGEEDAAVVDLGPRDMLPGGSDPSPDIVELSAAMKADGDAAGPEGPSQDPGGSGGGPAAAQDEPAEDMEDPACLLLAGCRAVREALDAGDPAALGPAAGNVSDVALTYGMRSLADMALCVRDACDSGDMHGAVQAAQDMLAEMERSAQGQKPVS
ncbi:MAG: hypothetical protein ACQGQP_00900 [Desulfovibrio sp.]